MATNHTTNYNLNLWEPTDSFLREEFNENTSKIEAALKDHADQLATRGNCNFYFNYHTGTGEYGASHPSKVAVPKQPKFVIIIDSETGKFLMHAYYSEIALSPWYPNNPVTMSSNNELNPDGTRTFYLKWYSDSPEHQFNLSYRGYCVIVLYTT